MIFNTTYKNSLFLDWHKKANELTNSEFMLLIKTGSDTIENTVALCPNCHRKMHVLNSKKDIEYLIER